LELERVIARRWVEVERTVLRVHVDQPLSVFKQKAVAWRQGLCGCSVVDWDNAEPSGGVPGGNHPGKVVMRCKALITGTAQRQAIEGANKGYNCATS
jgi:hypothetical protein